MLVLTTPPAAMVPVAVPWPLTPGFVACTVWLPGGTLRMPNQPLPSVTVADPGRPTTSTVAWSTGWPWCVTVPSKMPVVGACFHAGMGGSTQPG